MTLDPPADLATPPRKWKPYPAYKDSGVEWLGQLPEHWDVIPLKRTVTCLDGQRVPLNAEQRSHMQGDIPYWGANGIVDHIDSWLFDETLVLVGEDGAPFLEPAKPVSFVTTGKVWVNNHTHVLRPRSGARPDFLMQALNCVDYSAFIDGATREKLTQSDMNEIALQWPSAAEQRAIADFLDQETGKIDALVAKKERLIELLQEKRAALISHAVTKGLDPTVPMKDSGVEWLGDVPAHWDLRPLRRISPRIGVGVVVNPSTYLADEGVPFLYGSDVAPGRIIADSARRIRPSVSRQLPQSMLAEGDLVTVRVGDPGVTAVVPPQLAGANCASVMLTRAARGFVSEWLCYAMNSRLGAHQVELVQYGAAQKQFNIAHAVDFVFPVPPRAEQQRIADHLDRETSKLDALIGKVREVIGRLQEYRTALISAAVTGKIDVRESGA